jgi:hypothetical protein
MQQPENRARVQAIAARSRGGHGTPAPASTPPAPPAPPVKKRHYAPGQHWTQQPENKAKLARLKKGAARARRAAAAAATK